MENVNKKLNSLQLVKARAAMRTKRRIAIVAEERALAEQEMKLQTEAHGKAAPVSPKKG